ncbi:MAG TPA: hypothetical protein VL096_21405, partial [Pirellulaceae bacterium]|nr:hypothetical protein [Pirellulaceae bacterium]
MRFTLERLEQRRLLATIAWDLGVVTVLGTAGDEAIVAEIDAEHLVFSGSETRIPIGEVMRLDVQLLDGNDSFTNDTPFPATIDGGAGDDTLLGGTGPDVLLGGAGADRLEGRAGDDRLDGGGESQDQLFGGDGIDFIAGVTVTIGADRVVTVHGTAATEEIRLLNVGLYLRVDGAEHPRQLATDVKRVDVYLGDGDDLFTNGTSRIVNVWGEGGNDNLSSFGKDIVDGGAGHNVLLGSDQLNRIEWTGNNLVLTGT